jgi:hypothetical protein
MAFLTAVRNTLKFKDTAIMDMQFVPIADNVKIYVGGMVGVNSAGLAVRGGDATCVTVLGKADVPYLPQPPSQNTSPNTVYDNTYSGHAASSLQVVVRTGVFKWTNGTSADAITQADVGQDCYAIDDQTVGRVPSTGRPRAGKVVLIDADGGIWVSMGYFAQPGLGMQPLTLPVTLASLVVGGGTIAGPITLGFSCRIMGISYVAAVSGAGAGATMAVNLQIGGVSTTGGVCTITLANTAYAATPVLGTAVTALNIVSPTSTITLINAAGTVFTGGSGYFLIQLA